MLEDEAVLGCTVEKDSRLGQEMVERHAETLIRVGSTTIRQFEGLLLKSIFALAFHCSGSRKLCTGVWPVFEVEGSKPRHVHSFCQEPLLVSFSS